MRSIILTSQRLIDSSYYRFVCYKSAIFIGMCVYGKCMIGLKAICMKRIASCTIHWKIGSVSAVTIDYLFREMERLSREASCRYQSIFFLFYFIKQQYYLLYLFEL